MSKVINVQALNTLSAAIKEQLDIIGKATFETGRLLCEAQELLPKKSDIVMWAEAEVSLKKAQTYRLMQVYRAFSDEPWAHGVAVDALAMLIGNDEAKEVAKSVVESGDSLVTSDVKSIVAELAEEAGEKAPEQPKPVDKTQDELAKEVERMHQQAAKFEKQAQEFTKARDVAIVAARTMEQQLADAQKKVEELESANSVKAKIIEEQHKTIQKLRAELRGVEFEEEDEELTEQADDVPWDEDEEESEELDLSVFKGHYEELQLASPRKMVDNTKQAADLAGIESHGTGRALKFTVNGEELTGAELRALIK